MSVHPALPRTETVAGTRGPWLPIWLLIVLWTVLIGGFWGWSAYRSYRSELGTAVAVARDNFNKDLVYRRWAAKQGGVYVPTTDETPPNPHLVDIPEREITTPSGRQLTLVNPAYMVRQVHELGRTQYGLKAHITSLKPIRPENAADGWETQALRQFAAGGKEVVSLELLDGAPYLRLMRPLLTEETCLKCHARQGYKIGEVRGGISVSVPWTPYREALIRRIIFDASIFAGIWLIGIVGITAWNQNLNLFLRERERTDDVLQVERDRARQYLDIADSILVGLAPDQTITLINRKGCELLGYPPEALIGRNWLDLALPEPERDIMKAMFLRLVGGELEPVEYVESHVVTRVDDVRLIVWHNSLVRDAAGAIVGTLSSGADVTERRQTEEELSVNREMLNNILDNTRIHLWAFDGTRYLYTNKEWFDFTGQDPEATLTLERWVSAVHPDDRAPSGETWMKNWEAKTEHDNYFRLKRHDGVYRHFYCNAVPIFGSTGDFLYFQGFNIDITERKQAEDELRRMNTLTNMIVENIPNMIFLKDAGELRFVRFNRAGEDLFGASRDELLGKSDYDIFPKEQADFFVGKDREVLRGKAVVDIPDESLQTRDKGTRILHTRKVPLLDVNGDPEYLLGISEDITERRRSEEALRESEARYRRITEGLTDYQYSVRVENSRAVSTTQSPACALVTGYTPDEFAADPYLWIRMVVPEDRELIKRRVQTILAGEDIQPIEHRIVRKDGETRWVRDTTILVRDAAGGLLSYDGVIKDITEHKRAEEEQERLIVAIEQAGEAVVITDTNGTIRYVNPMFETVAGYTRAEAVGRNPRILKSGKQDESFYRELWQTITSGRVWHGRIVNRRKDGSLYTEEATISPVHDSAGRIVNFVAVKRDITEQLRALDEKARLEDQLRQSQKMESIGTLAGGVAHDFNNILTAITGYGHLALMKMAADDPQRLYVQNMLEASDRAAHLTSDLLLFSRKQPITRKDIDLNAGIGKLGKFLVRVIGEDIAFKSQLSEGEIPVLADEHQINQVLMNLATNARDAMPEGGVFSIGTQKILLDEQFVTTQHFGKPGTYALISVSDTGTGMDEPTRQRIFEPFFTTKDPGKGTGLGMAVVYGIVTQHDGLVTVDSELGKGTTFRIYLPVISTGAVAEGQAADEQPQPGGTETILLAEDDRAVREVTLLLLRDLGYTVIAAVDGDDAVRKFRENRDRIRLLLFDLIMPNKTGKEAFDEIRILQPDIKVIFASGYDPDMVRQKSLRELKLPIIGKPLKISALLKLIRSVLDA